MSFCGLPNHIFQEIEKIFMVLLSPKRSSYVYLSILLWPENRFKKTREKFSSPMHANFLSQGECGSHAYNLGTIGRVYHYILVPGSIGEGLSLDFGPRVPLPKWLKSGLNMHWYGIFLHIKMNAVISCVVIRPHIPKTIQLSSSFCCLGLKWIEHYKPYFLPLRWCKKTGTGTSL